MTDPFKPLKTYEDATPGPWNKDETHDGEEVFVTGQWDNPGDWDDRPIVATATEGLTPGDARHIATWDPETCREVVGLLEAAYKAGALNKLPPMGWLGRIDALLAKLGEGDQE